MEQQTGTRNESMVNYHGFIPLLVPQGHPHWDGYGLPLLEWDKEISLIPPGMRERAREPNLEEKRTRLKKRIRTKHQKRTRLQDKREQ